MFFAFGGAKKNESRMATWVETGLYRPIDQIIDFLCNLHLFFCSFDFLVPGSTQFGLVPFWKPGESFCSPSPIFPSSDLDTFGGPG